MILRVSDVKMAPALHQVLSEAFAVYRPLYTVRAYVSTVVSARRFKRRILSGEAEVYCCIINGEMAGTCSLKIEGNNLLIFSMGVKPAFAGQGIGKALLKAIEARAVESKCQSIILETYHPLTPAINLYEKLGFQRTGNSRDYFGITIFEMIRKM